MLELSQYEASVYHEAADRPYFYLDPAAGYLSLSGETRLDFLQRQSTNDLSLLSTAHALLTVLTSPTAKILDVLLLLDDGGSIAMLPLPDRLAATARFLRSRIFFMDKVTIEDASPGWAQIELGGNGSKQILETLGLPLPDHASAASCTASPSDTMRVVRVANRFPGDYLILTEQSVLESVLATIQQAGTVELTSDVHEMLRIEKGIPGATAELTEEYTPLEAGLQEAVAQGKGCYTGQEVIARQLTYDKVVQRLVRLRADAPVSVGDHLFADGRRVGVITSAAKSPGEGIIALGYVRQPEYEEGHVFGVTPGEDRPRVTVGWLPIEISQKEPPH